MAARKSETGGSTISNIIWLLIFAGALYAAWNVVPVYYDHYSLQDRALEMSRLHPSVQGNKDDQILVKMMKAVRELRLDQYIYQENIRIHTRETSRLIEIKYARDANVLPGMKHTFNLDILVDSPFY